MRLGLEPSGWFLVLLFIVIFNLPGNQVECLFIIPSMLMAAMTGGLIMSKMSLGMGGLLMMLMAANQQQSGQNFLRNLGVIPHAPISTGISVPTLSASNGANLFTQDLIVRRRRDLKNAEKTKDEKPLIVDANTQYRIMRQVASSDSQNCLPSALCGISAAPPSSQSGFLNDYAYLLKTVFTREEDIDELDDDFEDLKYSALKKKKKNGQKKKTTSQKKKENSDLEDSSEEEEDVNDDEISEQRRREEEELDDLVNEELLKRDPEFFSYAMKDTMQRKPNKPHHSYKLPPQRPKGPPQPPGFGDLASGDLNKMSEDQLDAMLAQLGDAPSERRPSGSLLSRIMPKLSLGLSPSKNENFGEDPFFSGFKRNMESRSLELSNVNVRPATLEEEKLFQELRERRQRRRDYIAQTRKELHEVQDPVERFRIAAEFGQKLKSPRQCRVLFNSCPFNYTQVLGMVADMRKALMGEPLNPPQADTVVNLKPFVLATPPPPVKNVINFNTGSGSENGGMTSIMHELPTGEKVEINLKMVKAGSGALIQTTGKRPNKPSETPTISAQTGFTKNKHKQSGSQEDLFDIDNHDNENTSTPIKSLESLKATMMAIQKINSASKKKETKPLYSQVLSKLDSQTQDTPIVGAKPGSNTLNITNKLQTQNNKHKKKYNNPQTTASLLASSFGSSKDEDDEADDNLSSLIAGVKRVSSSPGAKPNKELAEILIRLQNKKAGKGKPNINKSKLQDEAEVTEEEEEEEEEEDDEEEDEIDDMNSAFKSQSYPQENGKRRRPGSSTSGSSFPLSPLFDTRRSPTSQVTMTRRNKVKKPRKLFVGHDIQLPRSVPL